MTLTPLTDGFSLPLLLGERINISGATVRLRGLGIVGLRQLILSLVVPAALLVAPSPVGGQTARPDTTNGILDQAQILSRDDVRTIRDKLPQLTERLGTDFFLVTIDDQQEVWRRHPTHRHMVDQAFTELEAARKKEFGGVRKLTILVLFKPSPSSKHSHIPHLKTNAEALDATLLVTKFFSGFDTAEKKVRMLDKNHAPAESYATWVLRYLGELDAKVDPVVAKVQLSVLEQWGRFLSVLVEFFFDIVSRDTEKVPVIGPYLSWFFIHAAMLVLGTKGMPGFVIVPALSLVGFLASAQFKRMLPPGMGYRFAADWAVQALVFVPIIALLSTIARYDIEHMLFLSERFKIDQDILLERAEEMWHFDFEMRWQYALAFAIIALLLEWAARQAERASSTGTGDSSAGSRQFIWYWAGPMALAFLQGGALWVLPGVAAAYILVIMMLSRLARIAKGRVQVTQHRQPRPVAAFMSARGARK